MYFGMYFGTYIPKMSCNLKLLLGKQSVQRFQLNQDYDHTQKESVLPAPKTLDIRGTSEKPIPMSSTMLRSKMGTIKQ